MKHLKKLKQFDMFPAPINLNMQRGRSSDREYISEYSSYWGLVMSLMCTILSLGYFVYLVIRMNAMQDDTISSFTMYNSMDEMDGLQSLNVTEFGLMPNLRF